jgi:2-polyprenyl-3-methyl-5-hydroxy-6-metoxy-1,4-benzoquinol methylase
MNATLVPRSCPVCGHAEAADYMHKGGLRLVRCCSCKMIYASPVPGEFVSGKYYDRLATEYYLTPAKLESDFADVRFDREVRLFRKHCVRGTMLDVGCSTGAFLWQLAKRFPGDYELVGTDTSGPALDYASSRGLQIIRGTFPDADFAGKEFDALTFWAVVEHLSDPKGFLQRAWSILKPMGLCFVLVPNMQSLAVRLLGRRYRYIYAQHLNYFTRRTLLKLVEHRFSVLEFVSIHFNPVVIWQDWRGGGAEVSEVQRAELLKRTTAYKQNPLLRPVKGLYHLAEKILGRLNLADNLALVLQKK